MLTVTTSIVTLPPDHIVILGGYLLENGKTNRLATKPSMTALATFLETSQFTPHSGCPYFKIPYYLPPAPQRVHITPSELHLRLFSGCVDRSSSPSPDGSHCLHPGPILDQM